MHFADRLTQAILQKQNPTVVGLDPRVDKIDPAILERNKQKFGPTMKGIAASILEFNMGIIEAIKDIVPAVKPQIAFYEMYGAEGIWAFDATCRHAQEQGLIVIADGKRNDIGSTCEAYAKAFLGSVDVFGHQEEAFHADALTVTPYLGSDGIMPFVQRCHDNEKGIFVLVKTSNPSSIEIQDQPIGDEVVHEYVAQLVEGWGREDLSEQFKFSSVGAVVGATYPEDISLLRTLMPRSIFLVPGFGAQGGTVEDVKRAFIGNGTGAIINSSRGIIFAYEKNEVYGPENYAEAAREAALKMKDDLQIIFTESK